MVLRHVAVFYGQTLVCIDIHDGMLSVACCGVLQCVAVCCSVLQCVAVSNERHRERERKTQRKRKCDKERETARK